MKGQALNPYLPSYEYVPDGEPHNFDGRVYLFGSHDRFNGKTFCMNDYVCWSAPESDLSDWRFEGIIWKKTDDPHYKKGKYMYAPDVCKGPDGKYYLYYGFSTGLTLKSWAIRCAVSEKPTGPYRYYGEVDLLPWAKEYLPFDPAVYVENGRVWLYYGSSLFYPVLGTSRKKVKGGAVVELEADMLTVKTPPKLTVPMHGGEYGIHGFFEASSLRKFGDNYYFIYSSMQGHELCYATSDRPDGEWHFGGTIVSIGNIGLRNHKDIKTASNYTGNTHGSIVKANGEYYVFYHRQTNRHCFSRQGCAERVQINADGSIDQVETTSCGLNGKPLKGKGTYGANIACDLISSKGSRFQGGLFKLSKGVYPYFTQSGADRENDPDQYIANMHNNSVAGFRYFDCQDVKKISITARGGGSGVMRVSLNNGGVTVSSLVIEKSKKWHKYFAPVDIANGVHALYFTFSGTGGIDFKDFTLE